MYMDINYQGDFYFTFQDVAVLPDPIRFNASSLQTEDNRWSVFWETIFFNPGDDQLWIEGAFNLPDLRILPRPHGNNHWNDRINAVSFPAQGPTGDNDNRTIIHADGHVTVGNKKLSSAEVDDLRLERSVRRLIFPERTPKVAGDVRLEIESDVMLLDGRRICRIRATAKDSLGTEALVSKLSLQLVGALQAERTIDYCSEVTISTVDDVGGSVTDQIVAIASAPGISPVKKIVSSQRGSQAAFIPNTFHRATFGADGQLDRGQDIEIKGPNVQVFHSAEGIVGFSFAKVISTKLVQNNVVKYSFSTPTDQSSYYQVTPGTYTHTLDAQASQDSNFPHPPFSLATAVSTLHYYTS
jgi:hypothetical protein